jgi:hypothetical protein
MNGRRPIFGAKEQRQGDCHADPQDKSKLRFSGHDGIYMWNAIVFGRACPGRDEFSPLAQTI